VTVPHPRKDLPIATVKSIEREPGTRFLPGRYVLSDDEQAADRARGFSTILVDGDPVPFAALAKRE